MRVEGNVNIKAPPEKVWKVLTDPRKVSQCTPGLESLKIITPGRKFQAVGSLGLGSLKIRFTTDVEWLELEPPRRARMKMNGKASGSSIDVGSEMELVDGPDGSTSMKWSAEVKVLGDIASLAARLMKPVTQKMTGQFFNCLKKKVEK